MNEVSNENFGDLYPKIENAINTALFIAIDAEFSGIHSEENVKLSLFDSLGHRYKTLQKNIQPFDIVQFGIATFQHDIDKNAYIAECFNFYLFPTSVPLKNRQVTWQVTALEFLCRHNFDFNKFVSCGLSYLDKTDEEILRQHLQEDKIMNNVEYLSYEEEDDFRDCKSKVLKWLMNKSKQPMLKLEAASPILQYMVHKELRNNFKNIWTVSGHKSVHIIQVTNDVRELLEKEDMSHLEETLLDTYVGFSKVFKLLSDSKKPVIGHNILLDLMFMHQQFYKPLPDVYEEFKRNIHLLFPQIYDTKCLSYEMQKLFSKGEVNWKLNSLSNVYEYFASDKGSRLAFNSPKIHLSHNTGKKSYHNAGWDAYFAGYIFVKMGHIFCVKKFGSGLEERAITHSEFMSSVKPFANSVNISRGNESYMSFDGADPASSRPEWLHVKLKSPSIDTKEVVQKFSSFGQVDVMPYARRRVLVAVASHKSAQHILQHFRKSNELQVTKYCRIRHAAPSTICLWSGVILSGSMFAWMLKKTGRILELVG